MTKLKIAGLCVAALIGVVALMFLVWGIGFGFRWVTAGPSGQLEARQEILSGAMRITAYNHFFDLCAGVQENEAAIDAQEAKLAQLEPGSKEHSRTLDNIAGVTTARAGTIARYNTDAAKDYTIGQFRDLDLPYKLDPEKEDTTCVSADS